MVLPENNDMQQGTEFLTTPGKSFFIKEHLGYFGYNQIDLSGLSSIEVIAELVDEITSGSTKIDLHIDTPDGPLIGSSGLIEKIEIDYRKETERFKKEWEANGKKGPEPNYWSVRNILRPLFTLQLNPTEGSHDLYFVVENQEARVGQMILKINELNFIPSE